jgi:site-specific DNA-methyltransferase (adenine-specific)
MSRIELHNIDCLPYMKQCSDKQFDLAIVDPPYGIGMSKDINSITGGIKFNPKDWDDSIPSQEYFTELRRISQNQIIWGGNYFVEYLTNSMGWIVWDKNNGESTFADGELAWTSFNRAIRIKKVNWCGSSAIHETGINKIHPTQKPVALYKWLLHNYAKPGDKIIDTHLGSGSIALACEEYGYDLVGIEIDQEYFEAASKRLSDYRVQMRLF